MAGHNKWSKIKHRKAVVDKRRGKAWTMCSRAIIVAAKTGGPDPAFNFALRAAIDEARYHNVPADNIDRAIKKGVGGGAGDDYEPVRYEGYGPGGAAIVIDAFTNNRARTAGDLRLILGNHAGKLGTTGCVAHQFEQKGRIVVLDDSRGEDAILEAALNAGADDVRRTESEDGAPAWDVLCPPGQLHAVKNALAAAGLKTGEAVLDMIPTSSVTIDGENARTLVELVDALEENDDVKKVYTNADIPDAALPD
ncbi:MAG: YebC/PmpR family DNA-binding transcriptional regulator [Phycisphaerales bacterium]